MLQTREYQILRKTFVMITKNKSLKNFILSYNFTNIIRRHLLRYTWQLSAKKNYSWMLPLCVEKNRKTIKNYLSFYNREI